MPAWFFAQLSLNEEHACSTVKLISLTISENPKTVNVRGLILVGDIYPELNYQRREEFSHRGMNSDINSQRTPVGTFWRTDSSTN